MERRTPQPWDKNTRWRAIPHERGAARRQQRFDVLAFHLGIDRAVFEPGDEAGFRAFRRGIWRPRMVGEGQIRA